MLNHMEHEMHQAIHTAPPPGLAALSEGSDLITVDSLAIWCRCQGQTIRKNLSQHGHFHGLRPVRFGRRVMFRVADVAKLVEVAQ
jgi:hypothetical protein